MGSGPPPPPHPKKKKIKIKKKSKNIGFLSNTGLAPLKKHKAASILLGHHRHSSETPFKGRFTGGPMMARL